MLHKNITVYIRQVNNNTADAMTVIVKLNENGEQKKVALSKHISTEYNISPSKSLNISDNELLFYLYKHKSSLIGKIEFE